MGLGPRPVRKVNSVSDLHCCFPVSLLPEINIFLLCLPQLFKAMWITDSMRRGDNATYSIRLSSRQQWKSEPGRAGNLYCCLRGYRSAGC